MRLAQSREQCFRWFRVLYTYTAGLVLAVSTLRPDLFPRSATHTAWENALALLEVHEPLSKSVRVCKVALQRILTRIEQTQQTSSPADVNSILPDHQGPDFFQDFSSYLDDLSQFNLDNMSWLTEI